ncbi:hypothetical protein V6N13_043294 [Hibiscus sabdariffa]
MNRCFTYSFAQPKQIVRAADVSFQTLNVLSFDYVMGVASVSYPLVSLFLACSFTKDEERIAPSDAMDILQLKDRLLSSTVVTGWRSRMTVSTQRKMKNKFRLLIAVYFELYVSLEIL